MMNDTHTANIEVSVSSRLHRANSAMTKTSSGHGVPVAIHVPPPFVTLFTHAVI